MPRDDPPAIRPSRADLWAPLRPWIALEQRYARVMSRRRTTAFLYEFLRFGIKQGWACLFGGIMVGLLIATHYAYPAGAFLARYDFLFLAALTVQILMLRFRFETWQEAKIILVYHVIGTIMEIFKTSVGSWIYPEHAVFHVAGVPLFSGFMYACIGSYLARVWRLFDFRFTRHPPLAALGLLSVAIYVNFFTHHFTIDLRPLLFLAAAVLFGRSWIYYRIWRKWRSMPLLLGLLLVALFIWFAENAGTFSGVWLYPQQRQQWAIVGLGKFGAWFLLLIVSYTLVALVNRPINRAEPCES